MNMNQMLQCYVGTFPPHSTNKLQPLDVGIYKPFQTYYARAVDSWMMRNPGRRFSIYETAQCVGQAHEKCMVPATITNAFRKTGIMPYDRDVFTEEDFFCSSVTDRSEPSDDALTCNRTEQQIPTSRDPTPGEIPAPERAVASSSEDQSFKSSEAIRGYPKAQPRKPQRVQRRKGKCMIATDTPEKLELEERIKIRSQSLKKQKQVKRKVIESSDSEADDPQNNEELDENSSEQSGHMETHSSSQFEELDSPPAKGQFVLVRFKAKKDMDIYYISKVLEEVNENGDVYVSFLRKSVKCATKFIFPIFEELNYIPLEDIKAHLPNPRLGGQTKRQQCFLSFDFDFKNLNVR